MKATQEDQARPPGVAETRALTNRTTSKLLCLTRHAGVALRRPYVVRRQSGSTIYFLQALGGASGGAGRCRCGAGGQLPRAHHQR